MPNRYVS